MKKALIKYLNGWRISWLFSSELFKDECEKYGPIRLVSIGLFFVVAVVDNILGGAIWRLIGG